MDGVFIPFIPVGTWLVASAFLLLILLVIFGYHIYQRSRIRALTGDSVNIAEIAARKELLQADEAAIREWIKRQKEELSFLEGERHQQELVRADLSHLEQALSAKQQELADEINKAGEFEQQIFMKRQVLDELDQKIGNLEGKKAEAETLNQQLGKLHQELENAKLQAEDTAKLEVKHAELSVQAHLLEQTIAEHKQELEPLRTEAATLKQQLEELNRAIECSKSVAEKNAKLEVKNAELSVQAHLLEQTIAEHKQELEPLHDKKVKIQEWLAEARQISATELRTREALQQQVNELTTRKEVLSVEVERLRGELVRSSIGSQEDEPYADLLQVEPICMALNEFSSPAKEHEESDLLRQFKDSLRHDGFFFHERVIDAFHTSLKCHDINPLTVLAGVSGTGKTLLPIRYAEFMGMHRLVMAVQPRWDSPQDMFGFYNYLEKSYKASELSRVLVRMDPYNFSDDFKGGEWVYERMLLVLLDEMNLARTEYYFSEFLSKLELRRIIAEKDRANKERRSLAEIDLDAGPGGRRFKVWVPDNIFFVGTMNEDESTQTLSDKVLDRSNVLRFGKPNEKRQNTNEYNEHTKRDSFLPYATWQKWIHHHNDNDLEKEIYHWIGALNEALDGIGRPFGFRVCQAITAYVANYPRTEDDNRYKLAFADQIEQKVLPKLRGLDMGEDESGKTLNRIGSIIKILGDTPLEEAFSKAQNESEAIGMFHWRGVNRSVDEDV